jgi:hypothetical protein
MTPEQVAGHQVMWAEDNLRDYPYLLINPITGRMATRKLPGRWPTPEARQSRRQWRLCLQITETDMQDILGNPAGCRQDG